jgi:hypothetical protein
VSSDVGATLSSYEIEVPPAEAGGVPSEQQLQPKLNVSRIAR